jgi:hypothetical protein
MVLLDEGMNFRGEKFLEFPDGRLVNDDGDKIVVFLLFYSGKNLVEILEMNGFYFFVFGYFINQLLNILISDGCMLFFDVSVRDDKLSNFIIRFFRYILIVGMSCIRDGG